MIEPKTLNGQMTGTMAANPAAPLRGVELRPRSVEAQRRRKQTNPRPAIPHGIVPESTNFGGVPGQATPFDFALDGTQVIALYNVAGDAVPSDSASDQGGDVIASSDLQLLFWGNSWPNQSISPGQIVNAVQTILGGPFFEQLGQYGFSGLNLRESLQVLSDPPASFSSDDVGNMVWDLIDQGTFPEPDDSGGNILFMVFLPSEASPSENARGAHYDATDYDFPFDWDDAPVGWVSFGTLDYITDVFSHELMEMITDPLPGDDTGWTMNRTINGGNELGDACNNTVDRLDGVLVQAYWSNEFKACALPLGPLRSLGLNGATEAVARTREHIDMFWAGFDGSVQTNSWDGITGNAWNSLQSLAPPNSTVASRVAVVSRTPQNTDAFWVDAFGSVWTAFASTNVNNGAWSGSFPISGPGLALPGALAAVARTPDHIDVFWIAPDGTVWTNWWDAHANGGQWNTAFPISGPQAALSGGLTAVCRNPNHVDVFWVGYDGSIGTNWWDAGVNNAQWNTPFAITGPGLALTGALAAVSRDPDQLDVFWVTLDGSVYTNWWNANVNNGAWNTPFAIAGPGSALGGGMAAVGRQPQHLDVFWIARDGSVWTNWWDANANNGGWNAPFPVSSPGLAVPGTLDAACRTPDHIDVFWTSSDGAVWTNWWDAAANNGFWNVPFTIAQPGSAMVKDYSIPAVACAWDLCRQSQQLDAFWSTPGHAIETTFRNSFVNGGAWNAPFPLSTPGSSAGNLPVALARSANHIDLFWVASDGSIQSLVWDPFANAGWTTPFTVAAAGTAPPHAALSVVARNPYHIDLFWQGRDGAVHTLFWDAFFNNARWNTPFAITSGGIGSAGGLVTALSRSETQIDLFWSDRNGAVWTAWWNAFANGGQWNSPFTIAPVAAAVPGSPVAAACRHANHIDVFWTDANGTVWTNWWEVFINNAQWNTPFPVTPFGAALPGASLAAVCPHAFHIDLFWVDGNDTAWTNFWDQFAGSSWTAPVEVIIDDSGRGGAPVAALCRNCFDARLFWIEDDGSVWNAARPGAASSAGWSAPVLLAPAGSSSS